MKETRLELPDGAAVDGTEEPELATEEMLEDLQRSLATLTEEGVDTGISIGGAETFPEALYKIRRARDRVFPGLFADASWDIMLDLYDHRRRGRAVTISSACVASSVPPTTALRHLDVLTASGLVTRRSCPHDARSTYVELTQKGAELMDGWLSSTLRILSRWAADAGQPRGGEASSFAWDDDGA